MKLVSMAAAALWFASPAFAADAVTPAAVVDAFGAALKAGDAAALEKLLAPDVFIAESGGAERSFHSRLMETMTLQKTGEEWRIVHIHWSSAKIEEHGEH